MTLLINKKQLISELQQAFNDVYPFLKIELFARKHNFQQASAAQGRLPGHLSLQEVSPHLSDGEVELPETMRVQELEGIFIDRFGLYLQVFRKSGNLWLETTMTASWTLKLQNEHGREITNSIKEIL